MDVSILVYFDAWFSVFTDV